MDTSIVLDFDIFGYDIEDRREMKCLNEVIFIKMTQKSLKSNLNTTLREGVY